MARSSCGRSVRPATAPSRLRPSTEDRRSASWLCGPGNTAPDRHTHEKGHDRWPKLMLVAYRLAQLILGEFGIGQIGGQHRAIAHLQTAELRTLEHRMRQLGAPQRD